MAKIYCPHCGAKNEYTLKKPDKCFSCGKPFASIFSKPSSSAPVKAARTQKPINVDDDLDDDELDIDYVPPLNSLAYDVDYESMGNSIFKGSDFLDISEEEMKSKPKTKKITREKTKKTNLRRKKRGN